MKINGKNYEIPEIDIKTIKQLEEYEIYLMCGETPKKILTLISAFMCISAHISLEQAYEIIEKQVASGAGVGEWMEDITNAFDKSKLLKQIANKGKTKKLPFIFKINGSELK